MVVAASVAIAAAACQPRQAANSPGASAADSSRHGTEPPRVANLYAFARLYGVLRWFHPSDAAAEIDWSRFAIDGARRMIDVPDPTARRAALAELIAPFAPTVHFAGPGEAFPDEPALHPADADGLDVVAWQHTGYGDSALSSVYASKRLHRDRTVAVRGAPYGAVWQAVDAAPYRGGRVRLRGKLRTAARGRGQLWLRIDRSGAAGVRHEMADRPIVSAAWTTAEIITTIEADATQIVLGAMMGGGGTVWYDDLELAVQRIDGAWRPIELRDPGFETGDLAASWKPGLARGSAGKLDGWTTVLDRDRPASGAVSLRVAAATQVLHDEQFAEAPRPGETVDLDLGDGLRARVPIALYSRDGHTVGDDPEAARKAQPAIAGDAAAPAFERVAGAADVIVAWSVLEHFWPYWDVVAVDWIAELDTALRDALDDRSIDDHVATLQRLAAAAPDDHGRVACPGRAAQAHLPFAVDVVENQVAVIASADPAVQRGDVVIALDGRPAMTALADAEALASGTPQFRRWRARSQLGGGPSGAQVRVRLRRAGAERDVAIARGEREPAGSSRPAIDRLDDGVYYVDLERASLAEIEAVIADLAAAPAVVFDLRGYPNGNHRMLSYLLPRPDDARAWIAIPHVIRPDHAPFSIVGWTTLGWELPVREPHITGRVAFLVGPATASYGESILGLIEHYHLGALVGSTSGGTNGNVAEITEPTGCSSIFTGLRVTRLDGSRLHLLGFSPDVPASRTLAGLAAGRDEVLEAALAHVRRLP